LLAAWVNGEKIAWCDGVFQGDKDVCAYVRRMVKRGAVVDAPCGLVECDSTMLGALAAIWSYSPGRLQVVACPERVYLFFHMPPTDGNRGREDAATVGTGGGLGIPDGWEPSGNMFVGGVFEDGAIVDDSDEEGR
jgi:hypothetical protein